MKSPPPDARLAGVPVCWPAIQRMHGCPGWCGNKNVNLRPKEAAREAFTDSMLGMTGTINALVRDNLSKGSSADEQLEFMQDKYVIVDLEFAGPDKHPWTLEYLQDWDDHTLNQDGQYDTFSDMYQIGKLIEGLPFWGSSVRPPTLLSFVGLTPFFGLFIRCLHRLDTVSRRGVRPGNSALYQALGTGSSALPRL
ncbi:hypothetical protein WJX77_002696 [Trebouxia sp. C0004]